MKRTSWKTTCIVVGALIIGGVIARLLPTGNHKSLSRTEYLNSDVEKKNTTMWTCSMHPQVKQPKAGKCPLCFMDLIPVKSNSSDDKEGSTAGLTLSPRAQKLAEVETALVERKSVSKAIKMIGVVEYDESKIAHITARMPGRVDILYVNYTGIAVRKGDHMVGYYSPDLYVAQKELLQSAKALRRIQNLSVSEDKKMLESITSPRDISEKALLRSIIKRLKLWGLTNTNIRTILKTGKVVDLVTLYAPIAGIVIHKNAFEGKYFETGDRLFTIADLSKVWIMLEAYETDIPWLHYGQKITFTTASYPGESFEGKISFIEPFLNPKTRTITLRVDAPNPSGKLKPDMFVNAVVYSKVSQSGKAIAPDLAGKWICPMHPVVIKDKYGKCYICGMSLVKAESLGYTKAENSEIPLVIPASAPLIIGDRAVVYVNDKPGHYYGQVVQLGPRADNYYVVNTGLKEGDKVVVKGNFKIDSALQIQARPSMMGAKLPPGKKQAPVPDKPSAKKYKVTSILKEELAKLYAAYFKIQKNLAGDDLSKAQAAAKNILSLLTNIHEHGMSTDAVTKLHKLKKTMTLAAGSINTAKDITTARAQFANLSTAVYELLRQFGTAGKTVFKFHCPMIFDNRGAYWLQDNPDIVNPYYGDVMLKCGEKVEEIAK